MRVDPRVDAFWPHGRRAPCGTRWLRALLASGPMPARRVLEAGLKAGFTRSQVEVAKGRLGVHSRRVGHQWVWEA